MLSAAAAYLPSVYPLEYMLVRVLVMTGCDRLQPVIQNSQNKITVTKLISDLA